MVSTVAMSQRQPEPRARVPRSPSCDLRVARAHALDGMHWRRPEKDGDSRNRRIRIASQQYIKLYDQNILYIYEQNIKVRTPTCNNSSCATEGIHPRPLWGGSVGRDAPRRPSGPGLFSWWHETLITTRVQRADRHLCSRGREMNPWMHQVHDPVNVGRQLWRKRSVDVDAKNRQCAGV